MDSQRIKNLYHQYQETVAHVTPKQRELIKKFEPDLDVKTIVDVQKKIRHLIGNQKITPKQLELVQKYPKNKIDDILKRDVDLESLTRFELSRILNVLGDHWKMNPRIYHHPIHSDIEYEYGWQESPIFPDNKMYYLVFYNLLMVDIDQEKLDLDLMKTQLNKYNLSGRLYQTYNGYHLFITSCPISHRNSNAKKIMDLFCCDIYYMAFSYLNGYKIRLNPKIRCEENKAEEEIAAIFLQKIGDAPEDAKLCDLIKLHDHYIEYHKK